MRARAGFTTVVVGLLLVGGAVAADRVTHARAESAARAAVATGLDGVVGTPEVDIQGFPFLTQVWSGSLEHVTGSLAGATIGGTTARDVQLDAHGVHLGEPRTVDALTLAATVPTSAIRTVLAGRTGMANLQLAVRDGSLLLSVDQLGVPVQVAGTPAVSDGTLTLNVASVTIGAATIDVADLPSAVRAMVDELVVPVNDLPKGLVLTGAVVVPTGVRVTASGAHVPIPSTVR